jgi:hypothetical protein
VVDANSGVSVKRDRGFVHFFLFIIFFPEFVYGPSVGSIWSGICPILFIFFFFLNFCVGCRYVWAVVFSNFFF